MSSRFWKASGDALLPSRNFFSVAGAGTTFDPAHLTDMTLSGSNLIATRSAHAGFWADAYGTTAKSSGTFGVTINTIAAVNHLIGVAVDYSNASPGQTSDGGKTLAYNAASGVVGFDGSTLTTVATSTVGDKIEWVLTAGTSYALKKNGTTLYTVTFAALNAAVGGTAPICANPVLPVFAIGNSTNTTDQGTADFSGW